MLKDREPCAEGAGFALCPEEASPTLCRGHHRQSVVEDGSVAVYSVKWSRKGQEEGEPVTPFDNSGKRCHDLEPE